MTAVDVLAPRGLLFCWQYERFVLSLTEVNRRRRPDYFTTNIQMARLTWSFRWLIFKEKNGWRSTSQEFKADCAKSELESRKVFWGRANKLFLGHFVKPDISLWSQTYPLWTGAHVFTPWFCAAFLFRDNDFCTKAVPWTYKSRMRQGLVSMCTFLSISLTVIFIECCSRGCFG